MLYLGESVGVGGGTHTCLVGEQTAGDTVFYRLRDSYTGKAADGSSGIPCAYDYLTECLGIIFIIIIDIAPKI